jgi:hypothetical protein
MDSGGCQNSSGIVLLEKNQTALNMAVAVYILNLTEEKK